MQGYSNLDTISLHITNQCNIRCKGCYLGNKRDTQTMSISIAKQAIEILQPKNVVFFGGESILCPDLLINIMSCYPNLNYILHTSGTIYNKYILDKVKTIALTLDAFKYEYVICNKPTSKKIYNIRNTIIKDYISKIVITHNIHPNNNEPNFMDSLTSGLKDMNINFIPPIDWYLMVTREENQEYLDEYDEYTPINYINTQPKLRILQDGTVTRDMTGHFNICHISKWKQRYKTNSMPISNKCKECKYLYKCHACNMFPHFCKIILDSISYKPHFCKFTEIYWNRKEKY